MFMAIAVAGFGPLSDGSAMVNACERSEQADSFVGALEPKRVSVRMLCRSFGDCRQTACCETDSVLMRWPGKQCGPVTGIYLPLRWVPPDLP
jgi:hypothetical protein